MLVVVPLPKSQNRLVMVPVELSVKETVSGLTPLVGLAVKLATGTIAPVPRTTLVKLPAVAGAKRTTRLVEPNPDRLKGVPETILKGPALIVATPLVSAAPPRLVTTKLA